MLLNKFRGPVAETDLKETLNEIYKSIPLSDDSNFELEYEVLEEIGNELVQEEMEWYSCCFYNRGHAPYGHTMFLLLGRQMLQPEEIKTIDPRESFSSLHCLPLLQFVYNEW